MMSDFVACACGGACFVASMYMWPESRKAAYRRDDPACVRHRIVSLGLITGSTMAISVILRGSRETFRTFAATKSSLAHATLATCMLFAGVISTHTISTLQDVRARLSVMEKDPLAMTMPPSGSSPPPPAFRQRLKRIITVVVDCVVDRICPDSLEILLRNHVLCPLCEEYFFRAWMIGVLKHRPLRTRLIASTFFFATAHLHHFVRYYNTQRQYDMMWEKDTSAVRSGRKKAVLAAAKQSCSDFVMTAAFGLLASWMFEHPCDGLVLPCALSHSLCNAFGPPTVFNVLHGSEFSRTEKVLVVAAYAVGVGWFVKLVSRGD